MTKKRGIAIAIFMLIVLTNVVSAITITIDTKSSFSIGEDISFDYTILSTTNQEIEYMASVNCPNAPVALLEIKNASLTANTPFTESYTYMSDLTDDIEPQTCKAIVSISSPEETSKESSFVISTNPSFGFDFFTCKDANCAEKTKVFVLNDDIYLDYSSDVSGVSATATLTYPNGNPQQMTLPTSIKAEQIGTYDLEISASKQGYKTITENIQFGVIEKQASISYGFKEAVGKTNLTLLVILIASVVVIIISVAYLIYRRQVKRT